MTIALRILVAALFAVMVVGCGPSREGIGETVKTSMQEKFDTDPQLKDWHMKVAGVQVFSKGGNEYNGIATITHEGTPHDLPVEITVDGYNVMWQVAPGAFTFLLWD